MNQYPTSNFERETTRSVTRWVMAAYACMALALGSVLAIAASGIVHDLREIRMTRLNAELNRLRSHALRTVVNMQTILTENGGENPGLDTIRDNHYLRDHWARLVPSDPSRLYGAVVDPDGKIVMHSDPTNEGKYLGANWYERIADEVGDDVRETSNKALTEGQRAYDIQLPLTFRDRQLGTYHSGFNRDWFDSVAAEAQRRAMIRWVAILVFMLLVVVAAFVSLYHITRRVTLLGQSVRLAQARRFAELGQLIGGIAHEIRNPLNAMRLNLHMLERYQARDGQSAGPVEDTDELGSFDIIQETDREIQRVEELMKILLGYARPEQAHNDYISIATELDSTLRFLRPEMEGQDIRLRKHMPSEAVRVFMDRNRLRQIMLNLLNNAREAAGPGGEIDVSVECEAGVVRIEVSDNGPGAPPEDRERMFEPFFSTKELGTGLGLPLVKRFTEEAGGRVEYIERNAGGACFRLTLVEATPSANADELKQARTATLETAVSQRG